MNFLESLAFDFQPVTTTLAILPTHSADFEFVNFYNHMTSLFMLHLYVYVCVCSFAYIYMHVCMCIFACVYVNVLLILFSLKNLNIDASQIIMVLNPDMVENTVSRKYI